MSVECPYYVIERGEFVCLCMKSSKGEEIVLDYVEGTEPGARAYMEKRMAEKNSSYVLVRIL